MSRSPNRPDVEQGFDSFYVIGSERVAVPEGIAQGQHEANGMSHPPPNGDASRPHEEPHDEHDEIDDSNNTLWSRYEEAVKSRDKVRIEALKDDMDGILIFSGLFSAVITAFVVPKIQDLKVNPADQSAYYQQQTVQILAQISRQLASNQTPVSTDLTHPPSYPTFRASSSDCRIAVCWLMSIILSLCAALAATLVQQWARAHLRPFQRQDSLLKTLWIQIVLSGDVDRLQMVAGVVPWSIYLSLIFFFLGLSGAILNTDKFVGIFTVVLVSLCGLFYVSGVIASIIKPRWPYRNWLRNKIFRLIRHLRLALYDITFLGRAVCGNRKIETGQGQPDMEPTVESGVQDKRALHWLLDRINRSNDVETFILAIPSTFDREWSRSVWKAVVGEAQSTPLADFQVNPSPGASRTRERNTVSEFFARVRQLFESYNNETDSMNEAARSRAQACVETVSCLVFCADVPPTSFGEIGEVGEVLSEVGHKLRINRPLTVRSNPSFAVRWTCLSLVAIRQMVKAEGSRVQELAGFAVSGFSRLQVAAYGPPDAHALGVAQSVDDHLKTAWGQVEDLHRAFEPWSQSRTEEENRNILESYESQISELERIENEANGMDDIDWRISLLQDTIDEATHKLTRRLPGVSFNELKSSGPIPITEAFDFPIFRNTPITPQLIFPGQQLQPLFALGRGLRDVVEGRNPEIHKEILESLKSIRKISMPLRRPSHLMRRQLWRLQDLRDGGGLGFTVELFFLALRRLSSAPLSHDSRKVLYIGTFKAITSQWMDSKDSLGTQGILLDLVCDLVIQGRGVFSDFNYPTYIVDELLELVGRMVDGHGGLYPHINDAVQELQELDPGEGVDATLDKAFVAITQSQVPPLPP